MIVVDSSALVAVLRREAEADEFLHVIAANAGGCLLSSVSLLETSMVLAGRGGRAAAWAGLDALIARAGVQVMPQNGALAQVAREAFLRFGKGRHPAGLNLGDCATYALAKTQDLPLLFKGGEFSQTDLIPAAPARSELLP